MIWGVLSVGLIGHQFHAREMTREGAEVHIVTCRAHTTNKFGRKENVTDVVLYLERSPRIVMWVHEDVEALLAGVNLSR